MKLIPILYSPPMVQAILDGTKTVTRRKIKHPERLDGLMLAGEEAAWSDYGGPGDVHWVRVTFYAYGYWDRRYNADKERDEWHFVDLTLKLGESYRYADSPPEIVVQKREVGYRGWYKRPALFMPYAACRLWLKVESVRAERLQDISEKDAIAEGVERLPDWPEVPGRARYKLYGNVAVLPGQEAATFAPVDSYATLWESLHGPGSWEQNPWVWVVGFSRTEKPELT